jgi:hypothetical protein
MFDSGGVTPVKHKSEKKYDSRGVVHENYTSGFARSVKFVSELECKTHIYAWHKRKLVDAFESKTVDIENILPVINVSCTGIDLKQCFFAPVVFVFHANIKAMIVR